jgi:glycosyltransferase involved in cell wall biosynthesis
MKVIHAVSGFLPDAHGGTEVYVSELVGKLQKRGLYPIVAAPREDDRESTYFHNDIEVYRYPVPSHPSLEQWREIVPHQHFERFAEWLKRQAAPIFHQHSYRFDCGSHHLQLAKQLGMQTIVTLHIPEPICLRKTLMRNGIEPCDGKIDEMQCGICLGMSEKVPATISQTLGLLPPAVGRAAKRYLHRLPSYRVRQLGTTLGTPSQVRDKRQKFQEMAANADRIVLVCRWMYDMLLRNVIPEEKLVLCPQGSPIAPQRSRKLPKPANAPLKIGFVGRWHETKGIHILVEAIQKLPDHIPVEVVIHGSLHGKFHDGSEIQAQAMEIAKRDRRIQIKPVLNRDEVIATIAQFDLLAVPSQWLETGPLVALEAHAVGTPVLGSNLGGIAELVQHGINGWLVPASDVQAWSDAIAYLATHPDVVEELRRGISSVRTFDAVADEMKTLYERILVQKAVA